MEQTEVIKKNLRIEHDFDDDILAYNVEIASSILNTYVTSREEWTERLNEDPLFKHAVTVYVIYMYETGSGGNIKWSFNDAPPTFPRTVESILERLRRRVVTWTSQD